MRSFLKILFCSVLLLSPDLLFAQALSQPFAVVELFTSEGCNSCPVAEKLLSKISHDAEVNHQNIFCLEYHVDYWDRLGWKDPFSKNQFTRRQNTYSGVLKQRELYTPQMIVNGKTEFTGSDAAKANATIDKALKISSYLRLTVKVDSIRNDSIYLDYSSSHMDKNISLHFAFVERNVASRITKGENAGKTLTHDNLVRIFYSIPLNTNRGTAAIPLKGFALNASCDLISFAQNKQSMEILAVEKKSFSGFLKK